MTPQNPAASTDKLFMHDPAFPQWVKDVQAISAKKQVEAVRKKLADLNPGLDGKMAGFDRTGSPKIDVGAVTELGCSTETLIDLSPLRALSDLKVLSASGVFNSKARLADLSPLRGMSITRLNINNTKVSDLSALQGMPLQGNRLLESGCWVPRSWSFDTTVKLRKPAGDSRTAMSKLHDRGTPV